MLLTLLLGLFALPASAETPLLLQTTEDLAVEGLVATGGNPASFRLASKPSHGVARVDARSGKLTYAPARDTHGDDAFVVEFSEGQRTVKVPVTIRVTPVNDAPITRPLSLSTKEDVEVRGAAVATDVDGDTLCFKPGTLPAHGTITLDERSGALSYHPAPDTSGPDAFTLEVSDGALSTTLEVLVAVQPVDDAPLATAASFGGDEDTLISGQLEASDSEGDRLTFKVLVEPRRGTLQLDPKSGAFSYRPHPDVHGRDGFTFEVSDGALRAQAAVSLEVRSLNDVPAATPLALTTLEDVSVRGRVLGTDPDGDALTYRLLRPPEHGTARVELATGAVSYQPEGDFNGTDAFSVEVSEGRLSATSEVTLTVTAVNDAPVAMPATFALEEDAPFEGRVVATDVDGTALTYALAARPAHGAATVDALTGELRFVPRPDFNGDDLCTIEVSDGTLKAIAAVKLQVKAVNDAPVLQPLALTTREDAAVSGQLVARDVDSTLTFAVVTPAAHGEARVEAKTGAVTFQPAADFNGPDAFTVEVSDGSLTARAEVKVMVSAVNDAPVLAAVTFAIDEEGRLEQPLAATDADGDRLSYTLSGRPAHGAATLEAASGKLSYSPARDFNGEDHLTVEVSDGQARVTTAVRLEVRPINDGPVVRPLSLASPEDTSAQGKITATDVDSPLTFTIAAAPVHGEARVDGSGVVRWQPAADFNGTDRFVVRVSDGELSADCEVNITVPAVNDAPVAKASTLQVEEDRALEQVLSFSDVDGDALTSRLVRGPAHGVASVNAATGKLSYQPAHDFNGSDSVTVEVSDGKLKVSSLITLWVQPINDAPVAGPLALSTREDTACRGAVVASDVDRQALRYRVAQGAARGEASVDSATGQVSYMPGPDVNGADSFTIEVSDGALTVTSLVSVAVEAVDDPPVVHAATLEVREDTQGEGKLSVTEADGEQLTFRLVSLPRLGAVLLDAASGAWRFTPGADLNGDDALEFEVSDGKTPVAGTLKIHVVPVNDAPTLSSLALSTREDEPIEGQLAGADADGDALTYRLLAPASGLKLDSSTGRFRFVPAKDTHGPVRFEVVASDGTLTSAPATVLVTVQPQNDAPVARDGVLCLAEDEVTVGALEAHDVDGDALVYRVVKAPLHGSVKVMDASVGMYEYTPAANYAGEDAFTFSVTDPSLSTSTATVRLTVKEVNDPPVAVAELITAPYRGMISGQLKGYDRESRHLTFRLVEQPSNGELKLVDPRTGEFTFSTEGRGTTESAAKFEVDDGELVSQPGELIIRIRSM